MRPVTSNSDTANVWLALWSTTSFRKAATRTSISHVCSRDGELTPATSCPDGRPAPVGNRRLAGVQVWKTLFASLLGALVIKTLGEATKLLTSDAPGLDLVIYGFVLIAVVGLAPRGIAGLLTALFRWPFRAVAQPEGGNG